MDNQTNKNPLKQQLKDGIPLQFTPRYVPSKHYLSRGENPKQMLSSLNFFKKNMTVVSCNLKKYDK